MNLALDGPDRRELRLILNSLYNRNSMTMALAEAANSRNLEDLVKSGNFDFELMQLIQCAEQQGWLEELIELAKERTGDPAQMVRIQNLVERARARCADIPMNPRFRAFLEREGGSEDGDAVVRLCNRQEQEQALFSRFAAPLRSPLIYLLPGDTGAAHSSFIDRFRYYTLPLLLGEPHESFRDVSEPITSPWTGSRPTGAELPYLTTQLARKLDPKVPPAAAAFRSLPRFAGKIVLIQHLLYESKWSPNMIKLLREYIDFWRPAAEGKGERPWFVIFLQIVFNETETGGAIPGELEQLVSATENGSCRLIPLPPLGMVERADVHVWVEEHWRQYRTQANELLARLFPARDTRLPMVMVETELTNFIARL
ncbi:MAG TPA: effector-associated domain EAD1-containing protein [Bryobacteraceae bacterium]|jgi:hypothetical protein|nr:effector-associated domain EAD1-containing protein [Bryobacteraceae bacterium]